jgi:hypothetical protein
LSSNEKHVLTMCRDQNLETAYTRPSWSEAKSWTFRYASEVVQASHRSRCCCYRNSNQTESDHNAQPRWHSLWILHLDTDLCYHIALQ